MADQLVWSMYCSKSLLPPPTVAGAVVTRLAARIRFSTPVLKRTTHRLEMGSHLTTRASKSLSSTELRRPVTQTLWPTDSPPLSPWSVLSRDIFRTLAELVPPFKWMVSGPEFEPLLSRLVAKGVAVPVG
eukprot:Skav204608  [mRNA]  locus=scaffold1712:64569:70316:- [translate_table: standard]